MKTHSSQTAGVSMMESESDHGVLSPNFSLSAAKPSVDELSRMVSQHKQFVCHLQTQATFYEAELAKVTSEEASERAEESQIDGSSSGGQVEASLPIKEVCCLNASSSGFALKSASNSGSWIEALTIRKLKQEKSDLVELCSALQKTLSRFHSHEIDSQRQLQKALEVVELGNEAKAQAEVKVDQLQMKLASLAKKVEQEEIKHRQTCSEIEESKSAEIEEQKKEMEKVGKKLLETQRKLDKEERQKGALEQEVVVQKEKILYLKRQLEDASGDLLDKTKKMELEKKDLRRLVEEEKLKCARLKDSKHKMRNEIESTTWELEERAKRAEKWSSECEAKCFTFQENIIQLEKHILDGNRSKSDAEYKTKVLEKEKKHLEKRVEELEWRMNELHQDSETAISELKQVLEDSKEDAEKRKLEITSLKGSFHLNIKKLQKEAQSNAEHIEAKVIELQKKATQYQDDCSTLKQQNHRLKKLLKETDDRAMSSHQQVLALMLRQKELMEDRQVLFTQLDHFSSADGLP
eukprot:m.86798 g.86798  ORF g.86798 m.86798 type:complete len:522 (+) comp36513_c0_seq1:153-1718(+)